MAFNSVLTRGAVNHPSTFCLFTVGGEKPFKRTVFNLPL